MLEYSDWFPAWDLDGRSPAWALQKCLEKLANPAKLGWFSTVFFIHKLLAAARGGGVWMQDVVGTYTDLKSLRARRTSIRSSELPTPLWKEFLTVFEKSFTFVQDLYYTFFVDDINMQGPTEHHSVAHAIVVSAVVLLCLVYQYLIGYVDRGGSKADSSGSLEFRDTYISIVLFLGSYIWIKSRDVAPIPESAIRKCRRQRKRDGGITVKYEPRFKPRKEGNVDTDRLYLGQFHTRIEAEVVYRTAASCYEYSKDYGSQVDLGDGRSFTIPPLSEDERGLSGLEKENMVQARAKRVHKAFVEVWNSPSTLPGAEMPQQLLLPSIQVGEGNALLQVPGYQTQNSGMMQDISMQVFPAQRIMQTPQLPCQDISHVPQRIVEELTRQNLQLQQDVRRLEFQVLQMVQRQEQVVQRQEQVVQRQEQVVQRQEQVVQRQEQVVQRQELQLQQQTCWRRPEEAHSDSLQAMFNQFSRPEQDQNPESTHLQRQLMSPTHAIPRWELELIQMNGGDGGMSDEVLRMDGDGSDNLG